MTRRRLILLAIPVPAGDRRRRVAWPSRTGRRSAAGRRRRASPTTAPACRTGRSTSSSRTTSSRSSGSNTTRTVAAASAVAAAADSAGRRGGGGSGAAAAGLTDWPDSDLNFSFRLQQLTSLKVNPDPITLRLTDERLFDYPFIYMIEPGGLSFSEEEVVGAAPLPAQRRLPDGRRLLGRRRVGELLPADQARLPQTASPRSCRSTTRSSSASTA